jgi:hypothetical protein
MLRVVTPGVRSFPPHLAHSRAGGVLALFLQWRLADVAVGSHMLHAGTLRCRVGRCARKKKIMPVIAKFCGIVMRVLIDRTFGVHLHAFYGDSEMVIGFNPMRVIQSDVPAWVQDWVLWWVQHHQDEVLSTRKIDLDLATPISRQAAAQLGFAD